METCGPNGRRETGMVFTKLSMEPVDTEAVNDPTLVTETDIWTIFRALRDARSAYNLRPGHIQTLQAMLSFLKPGHGDTVFASNYSICQRVGGIDERTLRRHINRFIELGFIERNDSSNGKRYRTRSSQGHCISYGLSLTPLRRRAKDLFALAQQLENDRRDRLFIRKQILAKLAYLETQGSLSDIILKTRKTLRRKLDISAYQAILAQLSATSEDLEIEDQMPKATKLPANDGQTVRHQPRSEKEGIDLDRNESEAPIKSEVLLSVCDQALSFSSEPLRDWRDIEKHARTLSPMMGIAPETFEAAKKTIGAQNASSTVFILLQLGEKIRDFRAYFLSVTLGKRRRQFSPAKMLERLARNQEQFV